MKNREPRLQSLAVQSALEDLDDLRGQALADAAFERKVAALRRRAQREILGSFGKALKAFSGHWRALDKRHEAERARFLRREGSVLGRVVNALPHAPASLAAGYAEFRDSLQSANIRERALMRAQGREREALALRQRRYRQALSKPHQDALDLLSVKTDRTLSPEIPKPSLAASLAFDLEAARQRIAREMAAGAYTPAARSRGRARDQAKEYEPDPE